MKCHIRKIPQRTTKLQLLCRCFTSPRRESLLRKAMKIGGAPAGIKEIADEGFASPEDAVFIRSIGTTRRVFLLKPHLTPGQIGGMAYRIHALTTNEALNSVIVASIPERNNPYCLPTSMLDRPDWETSSIYLGLPPAPGSTYYVAGGYDPLQLYQRRDHRNPHAIQTLLNDISNLTLAVYGDAVATRIPTISIPHGLFHDAGFAICGMASYVIATRESCFRIENPSRGLAFDPVGFSYILPRLGREFRQESANYPGCGMILALTGFEADAPDLMETGLATNYADSVNGMRGFEHTLSEIRPWNQQAIIPNPTRYHGDPEPAVDHNAEHRNVSVADAVMGLTSYRADGAIVWECDEEDNEGQTDPSLDLNSLPWHEARYSNLVQAAIFFDDIFQSEITLVGIHERFREMAAQVADDDDPYDQQRIAWAKDFARRIEQRSPLALQAVFRLMKDGHQYLESMKSCMERERRVQAKLFASQDFANWAEYTLKGNSEPFTGWKHRSLAEVTDDEIDELLNDDGNAPLGESK